MTGCGVSLTGVGTRCVIAGSQTPEWWKLRSTPWTVAPPTVISHATAHSVHEMQVHTQGNPTYQAHGHPQKPETPWRKPRTRDTQPTTSRHEDEEPAHHAPPWAQLTHGHTNETRHFRRQKSHLWQPQHGNRRWVTKKWTHLVSMLAYHDPDTLFAHEFAPRNCASGRVPQSSSCTRARNPSGAVHP